MSGWTDEEKAEIIKKYQEAEPTPENSMEIVADLAEEYGKAPNGVRMVLTTAQVYVKKAASAGGTSTAAAGDKPKRVSKADAIAELTSAISDAEQEIDEEILSKLTGKAAQYFTGILRGIQS